MTAEGLDDKPIGSLQDVIRVLFFFSSRRRHTRLQGDWSSDVCSSDLCTRTTSRTARRAPSGQSAARRSIRSPPSRRSEERRVGKERSAARTTYQWKKAQTDTAQRAQTMHLPHGVEMTRERPEARKSEI